MPTLALFAWPLIALFLFSRLGPARGLIWAVAVGYLFLPENFIIPVPGFIDYEKSSAISFAALLGVLIYAGTRTRPRTGPGQAPPPDLQNANPWAGRLLAVFVACLFLGLVLTWLTNREPLVYTERTLQAMRPYDIVSLGASLLVVVLPYFLARRFLATTDLIRALLTALVILGVAYAFLAAFEIRMSPRLHSWIYGYFPHEWRQHLRDGGFRPLVFLRHSLWLGFFLASAMFAALAMARASTGERRLLFYGAALWIFVVIVLAKNFGAILIATGFGALLLVLRARMLARVAAVVSILFLIYPAVRQAQLVPIDPFVAAVGTISPARMASFEFRLEHEDRLLARALEKPVAGWGPWARWRVRDERGRDATVSDGLWIITLGERGWVGYVGFFGLLALPVLLLPAVARRKDIGFETAGIAIIMAANFVYLVPNSTLSPIGWMMAGALAGFVQFDRQKSSEAAPDAVPDPVRRSRYSRFPTAHARPDLALRR